MHGRLKGNPSIGAIAKIKMAEINASTQVTIITAITVISKRINISVSECLPL